MRKPNSPGTRRSVVYGMVGYIVFVLFFGVGATAIVSIIERQQTFRDLEAQARFLASELEVKLLYESTQSHYASLSQTLHSLEPTLMTLLSLEKRYQSITFFSKDATGEFQPLLSVNPSNSVEGAALDWSNDEQQSALHKVAELRQPTTIVDERRPSGSIVQVLSPVHEVDSGQLLAILAIEYTLPAWHRFGPRQVILLYSLTLAAIVFLLVGNAILLRSEQQTEEVNGIHAYRVSFQVAVVVMFITFAAALVSHEKESESRARAMFQLSSDKVTAIGKSLHSLEYVETEALARFFAASEYVTKSEFEGYTNYLMSNPSILAWLWIPEVSTDERSSFERQMQQEGLTGFAITDRIGEKSPGWTTQKDRYYPITRIASRHDYSTILGYDCYSNPSFRLAIDRARALRSITCTDPLRLSPFRKNLFVFKEVRLNGNTNHQPGYVACVVDLDRVFMSAGPSPMAALSMTSGLPADADSIQVSSRTPRLQSGETFSMTWPVFALDRLFVITSSAGPELYEIHPVRAAGFVLLAGTLLTIALTYLTLLIQRRRLKLEHLVAERTRELETTRHRAEMAVEAADIGIWDWNLVTSQVVLNDSWAKKLGFDNRQDVQSIDQWRAMISPEYQKRVNEVLQQYLRGETDIYEMEIPVHLSSGENLWIMSRGRVVERDDDGNPIRVNGTYLDLTQRKNDEAELVNREMQIRTLFNALPDLVWLKDADGRYLKCNPKFERFIGMSEQDLIGKTDYDFFDRDLASFFRARDQAVIEAGRPLRNEEEVTYADDGHTEVLETLKTPVLDVEGKLVGVLGIARDMTERKQAEAERESLQMQLVQAQKLDAIGSLAGGIAHDLNNLLVPIIGSAELLSQYSEQTAEDVESIETILSASFKARDLIRQLLAFSRKQALDVKLVDLNQVVLDIRDLLRRTIPENIQLHVHVSTEIKMIEADTNQLEQIIMNLIVNAVDAIVEQGSVTVETSVVHLDDEYSALHADVEAGEYVLLSVSDTGEGMDEETRLRIFEPFFSTKGEKGTGLGLATVFGIVKQHGGTVWVYSEPGKGTTFKIYLPVSSIQAEERTDYESEITLTGTETILVVEDSADVRKLTASILGKYGYQVVLARSGREAIEQVKSMDGEIAVLLTDVVMPEMNGRELFENLSQLIPGLRVIYMSGYTDDVVIHRGLLEREIDYIQKPFSMVDLVTKVRKTLDEKS